MPRHAVEDDDEPRRPWWALSVLAMISVLAVTATIFLLDGPRRRSDLAGPTAPAPTATRPPLPTARPGPPTTPARHTTAAPASRRSSPRAVVAPVARTTSEPRRTVAAVPPATPCAGRPRCVVPGDGGLAAALNAARARRGSAPVSAAVTSQAQQCALELGCSGGYALQAESAQSGAAAVRDLLADGGSDWLLAASTHAVAVGWAYDAPYGYVAVLLRAG